jgi:uncharacterized protein (PEP-CTERM system associated)
MRPEPGLLKPVARALALWLGVLTAAPVWAGAWQVQASTQADVVASNNVALANNQSAESDLVLTVTPQLRLVGLGAGYRIEGDVGFDLVSYLSRTRADHLYPRARLGINTQLVERLFYLDAAVDADTTAQNAFGVLNEGSNDLNRSVVTRERLSPYIRRELSPTSLLLLRSDNSWTQTADSAGTGVTVRAYVQSDVLRYEALPKPLGLQLQVARLQSRSDSAAAPDGVYRATFDTARLSLLYAPIPEFYVGLTGGRDQGAYGNTDVSGTLSGSLFRWQPSPRTDLYAAVEKRFFGTGWNGRFTHRSPFVVVSSSVSRDASTYAAELASLSPDSSVASLLDASLSTRITDPVERQAAVDAALRQRSLPRVQNGALNVGSANAQLVQTADVSLALLGIRHTVLLRGFQQTTTDLVGPTDVVVNSGNARQRGASLTLSRRLAPQTTVDLGLNYSRVIGFGATAGNRTVNKTARLGVSHDLSPRTSVATGVRRRLVDSNVVTTAQETAVYAGILHRF